MKNSFYHNEKAADTGPVLDEKSRDTVVMNQPSVDVSSDVSLDRKLE